MNRNELAIKGSTIGIVSQIITLLMKFIVRTFVIRYLGREILGLDGVLLDTINMLSLAEMGITSAMLYRLYTPVISKDEKRINELMATYRRIYHYIAIVVGGAGIVISFFLKYIITDISIPWDKIYLAFYLQLTCSVSSYLLAYQRILLNADQKKHLCLVADLIANIIFSILKVGSIVILKSYSVYLVLSILQTTASNVALKVYSTKEYPFVQPNHKADKEDMKVILYDTKDLLGNKLASYVYSSTDNLVVSIFLGTSVVGLLSNYKYIASALRSMVNSAMTTIQPLIGNYLNSDTSHEESYRTLNRYSFIRFCIAGMTVVPFMVIADSFVQIWAGSVDYLMPRTITIFLATEYYIGCVYGPLGEYILGMGQFKQGKYATMAGAVCNIVFSLIGAKFWGCEGVLLATVISQLIIWMGDYYIIMVRYYSDHKDYKIEYIKTHFRYAAIVALSVCMSISICSILPPNLWMQLVCGAIVAEIIFVGLMAIVCKKTDEFNYVITLVHKTIKKIA